jgi:hypothetical protein
MMAQHATEPFRRGPLCRYQVSSVSEWKSMMASRSPRRPMTASVSLEGSVITRCAVNATSAHVLNIKATRPPSSKSGQGFASTHVVASLVAAPSSSAAAKIVTWFTLSDAENRLSAPVTRPSSDVDLIRQSSRSVGSLSMMIGPRHTYDSGDNVRLSIEPFGPWDAQSHHNKP